MVVKTVWFVAIQKPDGTEGKLHIKDPRKIRKFRTPYLVVHYHLIRYELQVEPHGVKLVGPIDSNEFYYPLAIVVNEQNVHEFGPREGKFRQVMENMGWKQMLVANNGGMFQYKPEFMYIV